MSIYLDRLISLLCLEPVDDAVEDDSNRTVFRGQSQNIGTGRVFGGQVMGQAIAAAQQTITGRDIHSAHAYFLRPGDHHLPIFYSVETTRDGGSYSARTVTALQSGMPIFTMMCSFKNAEDSFEYAAPLFDTRVHEATTETFNFEQQFWRQHAKDEDAAQNRLPFLVKNFPQLDADENSLHESYWIKTTAEIAPERQDLHKVLLAYMSDFRILASTLRPVGYRQRLDSLVMATLCHAIWFHRPFRVDDWLLTQCEPLSVSGGRGLARAGVYSEDGQLVATMIQEGMLRISNKKGK